MNKPKPIGLCSICETEFRLSYDPKNQHYRRARRCPDCKRGSAIGRQSLVGLTKSKMLMESKNYFSFRSSLQKHAQRVFKVNGKAKECFVCGFQLYVEVCHIKAVKDFPDDSLILNINSSSNLVALCPNHHWAFDHDYLCLVAQEGIEPS